MASQNPSSEFGAQAPGRVGRTFLSLTRVLGPGWAAERTRILLRRLARPWLGDSVDTTVYGCRARLHVKGNICEKSALFAPHLYDTREREALAAVGRPGAVFVDVGANVGLYSLSIGRAWAVHPGTRILAVEPHPAIRARLEFNLAQNPDLPVEISEVAVLASEGAAGLKTGEKNLGETRISEGGDVPVQGTTLLGEMDRKAIDRLDALKVDVEGAEDQVLVPFLRSAPEELLPRVLVVENNPDQWQEDLLDWIGRRGLILRERTRMNLIFALQHPEGGGSPVAHRD